MAKEHILKIKEEYYKEVEAGNKTFELRKNDRDYQVNDTIVFNVIKENDSVYRSNKIYRITYILKDVAEYGLDKEYCVLAIQLCGIKEKEEEAECIYQFNSYEECAKTIGKALDLPYTAEAYDYWSYQMFLNDLNNGRGAEWVEAVEEHVKDKGLVLAFKKFVGYEEESEE